MIENYVASISKTSARDLTKAMILADRRFRNYPDPTIYDARYMAQQISKDRPGSYIDPQYLLSVWLELDKAGYTDNGKG